MKYNHVLFDLDGTITDSALGIMNALMYTFAKFGIEVEDKSDLRKFIGPPLYDSFVNFCGFDDEKANMGVKYYREYYADRGLIENEIMPGVKELLGELSELDVKMYVATSKPEKFAKKILQNLKLDGYFSIVAGATMDGARGSKIEVMDYLLKQIKAVNDDFDVDDAVMVGDRFYDIDGAKHFRMASIGVLFGYGNRTEFVNAGADYIIGRAEEIVDIVKSGTSMNDSDE